MAGAIISGMQLWFWAAVGGALLAGVSNFCFKIAAKRGYDAEVFSIYGGITSILFAFLGLIATTPTDLSLNVLAVVTFVAGTIATLGGVMKVYALRNIDTTIFFPLFKLFSPLLAVVSGLIFFAEHFSWQEWLGILLGLFVPLLLINRVEHTRQQNLVVGLGLMLLTAVTSASAATLNKYVIDRGLGEMVTLWYSAWGITVGTIILVLIRRGWRVVWHHIRDNSTKGLVWYASLRATLICFSMLCVLYAYGHGGALGVVQTIHSLYILIPIILAIIFYNEHWNAQKLIAVILSVVALAFLH